VASPKGVQGGKKKKKKDWGGHFVEKGGRKKRGSGPTFPKDPRGRGQEILPPSPCEKKKND